MKKENYFLPTSLKGRETSCWRGSPSPASGFVEGPRCACDSAHRYSSGTASSNSGTPWLYPLGLYQCMKACFRYISTVRHPAPRKGSSARRRHRRLLLIIARVLASKLYYVLKTRARWRLQVLSGGAELYYMARVFCTAPVSFVVV